MLVTVWSPTPKSAWIDAPQPFSLVEVTRFWVTARVLAPRGVGSTVNARLVAAAPVVLLIGPLAMTWAQQSSSFLW